MGKRTLRLARGAGFAIEVQRIVERATAWSEPEIGTSHRLVFVRRGAFRLRLSGWEEMADPTTAYFGRPGEEQSIAHRPYAEDICAVIGFDEWLAGEVVLEDAVPARPVRTTGPVDLAQRVLVARARAGADEFELAERVVRLVEAVRRSEQPAAVVPLSSAARRRLAESARELLVADPAFGGLNRLARTLGVSRSHLSRVFRAEAGETLTRFRNRVRVRAALDRIEAGEQSLARLAADLGFADQAHLTRTVRAEVGSPPARVRRLLAG